MRSLSYSGNWIWVGALSVDSAMRSMVATDEPFLFVIRMCSRLVIWRCGMGACVLRLSRRRAASRLLNHNKNGRRVASSRRENLIAGNLNPIIPNRPAGLGTIARERAALAGALYAGSNIGRDTSPSP